MHVRFSRSALALVALFAGTGCRGCHDDHPYVPYVIGSSETGASSLPPLADAGVLPNPRAEADASGADPDAIVAPPGLSRWPVDGVTLDAPEGTVFLLARVADFDGDGRRDAFAIVQRAGDPAEGGPSVTDPGRVLFYRGGSAPDVLTPVATFGPPPDFVRDPSCAPLARLAFAGKGAVLAELGARCPSRTWRTPARWVGIIAGGATPTLRLAATIADPAGAPALEVDAVVADRDGDGRDDLALRVALAPSTDTLSAEPPIAATLAWVDRPAGLSRDAAATDASFAALSASAMGRAAHSKDAFEVPPYVAQIRALWRAICANGGSPRVVAVAGVGAVPCSTAHALEQAGLADVRAYVTMGDPLRAALALDRAELAPASHTRSRLLEAQKWITTVAPVARARLLRAVAAVPMMRAAREPSWGPLAFEQAGKLLVHTAGGVVRVDPDGGDESATDLPAWNLAVTSPDGAAHWLEAYDPCDGLPLRATFELAGGSDARDIELPLSPPLGGRCVGSRGAPARAVPVAWGPGGLAALVAGDVVLVAPDLSHASRLDSFLGAPPLPGSPLSPDGKAYVVPTGAGLVVRGGTKTRLLRASELDGTYTEQQGCAVSNDQTHVACVRASGVWVGTWDAP